MARQADRIGQASSDLQVGSQAQKRRHASRTKQADRHAGRAEKAARQAGRAEQVGRQAVPCCHAGWQEGQSR
jgi:hypothetical protein